MPIKGGFEPIIFPSIWAAIAATFAAISSFLIMLAQRRNLLESAKPELVLYEWERENRGKGESFHEVIKFKKIKNVGRGIALHCYFMGYKEKDKKPISTVSALAQAVIASNELIEINGEIIIWWKNAENNRALGKYIIAPVSILSWDSIGYRHLTKYTLFIYENKAMNMNPKQIAPGIEMLSRTTKSQAVWFLKIKKRVRKIPLLGKMIRREEALLS